MLHARTVLLIATAHKQRNDCVELTHEHLSQIDQHRHLIRQKYNSDIYYYTLFRSFVAISKMVFRK